MPERRVGGGQQGGVVAPGGGQDGVAVQPMEKLVRAWIADPAPAEEH